MVALFVADKFSIGCRAFVIEFSPVHLIKINK